MNATNPNREDKRLGTLLREACSAPELPPRFQENIWRRIEQNAQAVSPVNWREALAALVFKPRFAFATVAALVLAGLLLGSIEGKTQARQQAQERYLAAVAMSFTP